MSTALNSREMGLNLSSGGTLKVLYSSLMFFFVGGN